MPDRGDAPPTGLGGFATRFPDRVFDVVIAEQHAITCAAGIAIGGLHPVVAIYSTFASRAFDQLLTDVALHQLPVTVVLDRAGITGPDGPSHHGMWDASLLPVVHGLRLAAPLDPALLTMAAAHRLVLAVEDTTTTGVLGARIAQALAAVVLKRLASTYRGKVTPKEI